MTTSSKTEETELFAPLPGQLGSPAAPGTALAVPTSAEIAELIGVRTIDYKGWIRALVDLEQFEEENKEDRGLSIVKAIILAETSEQALAAMNLRSAEDLIGKEPGNASNVLEITGAIPLESKYDDGPSAFAIISARDLAEGSDFSFSCGARGVQAAIISHMIHGWMPLKCRLVRRSKPTAKGFYPLNLEAGV